jgi:hypothetical protein
MRWNLDFKTRFTRYECDQQTNLLAPFDGTVFLRRVLRRGSSWTDIGQISYLKLPSNCPVHPSRRTAATKPKSFPSTLTGNLLHVQLIIDFEAARTYPSHHRHDTKPQRRHHHSTSTHPTHRPSSQTSTPTPEQKSPRFRSWTLIGRRHAALNPTHPNRKASRLRHQSDPESGDLETGLAPTIAALRWIREIQTIP